MRRVPDNLIVAPVLLCPADLPGIGRVWLRYERLDDGPVSHVRFCGLLTALPESVSAETLVDLALRETREEEN